MRTNPTIAVSVLLVAAVSLHSPRAYSVQPLDTLSAGKVNGSRIEVVPVSPFDPSTVGWVVGVQDSETHLKLIGITVRTPHETPDGKKIPGLTRLADIRTAGVNPGDFALAAQSGMIVSLCQRHDGRLVLISWDARSIKPASPHPEIKRLDTFTGGEKIGGHVELALVHTRDRFHTFVAAFRDQDNLRGKVVTFDVDKTSGKIHRRATIKATGKNLLSVGSISVLKRQNVDLTKRDVLVWAYTTLNGYVVRLLYVNPDGSFAMGAAASGEAAWRHVHVTHGNSPDDFLVFLVRDSDHYPVIHQYNVVSGGRALKRTKSTFVKEREGRETKIAVSADFFNGTKHHMAMVDASHRLRVMEVEEFGDQISINEDDKSQKWEATDPACESHGTFVLAAARKTKNNANTLMLVEYEF